MRTLRVNWDHLRSDVREHARFSHGGIRGFAGRAGFCEVTFSRFMGSRAHRAGLGTLNYLALCRYIGVDPMKYLEEIPEGYRVEEAV